MPFEIDAADAPNGVIDPGALHAELGAALGPAYNGIGSSDGAPWRFHVTWVDYPEDEAAASAAIAAVVAAHSGLPPPAPRTVADLEAENAELLTAVASLQARVAALEGA